MTSPIFSKMLFLYEILNAPGSSYWTLVSRSWSLLLLLEIVYTSVFMYITCEKSQEKSQELKQYLINLVQLISFEKFQQKSKVKSPVITDWIYWLRLTHYIQLHPKSWIPVWDKQMGPWYLNSVRQQHSTPIFQLLELGHRSQCVPSLNHVKAEGVKMTYG